LRVNDLAKEIGKNNNELIAYLKEKGVSKVAMSNISADEEKMLREKFNKIDGNKVVNNNKENNRQDGQQAISFYSIQFVSSFQCFFSVIINFFFPWLFRHNFLLVFSC